MNHGPVTQIDTDVAVFGGGTAGLHTAVAAREKGLKVLVAEKAHISRSGASRGGIDHFMASLETGEPWDSREADLRYGGRVLTWFEPIHYDL
jgi:succinate dehydrogenase/fumarate reductase flavoprotein subunit